MAKSSSNSGGKSNSENSKPSSSNGGSGSGGSGSKSSGSSGSRFAGSSGVSYKSGYGKSNINQSGQNAQSGPGKGSLPSVRLSASKAPASKVGGSTYNQGVNFSAADLKKGGYGSYRQPPGSGQRNQQEANRYLANQGVRLLGSSNQIEYKTPGKPNGLAGYNRLSNAIDRSRPNLQSILSGQVPYYADASYGAGEIGSMAGTGNPRPYGMAQSAFSRAPPQQQAKMQDRVPSGPDTFRNNYAAYQQPPGSPLRGGYDDIASAIGSRINSQVNQSQPLRGTTVKDVGSYSSAMMQRPDAGYGQAPQFRQTAMQSPMAGQGAPGIGPFSYPSPTATPERLAGARREFDQFSLNHNSQMAGNSYNQAPRPTAYSPPPDVANNTSQSTPDLYGGARQHPAPQVNIPGLDRLASGAGRIGDALQKPFDKVNGLFGKMGFGRPDYSGPLYGLGSSGQSDAERQPGGLMEGAVQPPYSRPMGPTRNQPPVAVQPPPVQASNPLLWPEYYSKWAGLPSGRYG